MMNSSEVDKFYRKVIKDFIVKLSKQDYLLRELEQNQIYLNQIEQKMFQKLHQPSRLFKRLTGKNNEIEKDMMNRFATTDDVHSVSREQIKNTISRSIPQQQSNHSSFSNDLNLINHRGQSGNIVKKENIKEEEQFHDSQQQPEDDKRSVKRQASQLSNEDISEISQENYENYEISKKLRENSKIHILGTYNSYAKRYNFKKNDTTIRLQNVFIKVQGMAQEMFINKLNCFCQKRSLQ